jgi:amidohydrolase
MTGRLPASLLTRLEQALPSAIALRRELHRYPELGHQEHRTTRLLAKALAGHAVRQPLGTTLLAGAQTTKDVVILRAELDGLPIQERTDVPWAARNGAMHACGHDVHMAALVALLRALPPDAPVVALFQPSEETDPSGARAILEHGLLSRPRAIVAAHLHPGLPWGHVSAAPGPVNASCDYLQLSVHGHGGHVAYPHRTTDPVLALCAIVLSAQQLVSRRADPTRSAVLALTRLEAGDADNVVPDSARAHGTLRALHPDDRRRLQGELRDLADGIAAGHRCRADLRIRQGEPALVNDTNLARALPQHVQTVGLTAGEPWRSCGSDDFGFYAAVAPTLMAFVGLDAAPEFEHQPLHNARFLPPDAAIGMIARALLAGYLAGSS